MKPMQKLIMLLLLTAMAGFPKLNIGQPLPFYEPWDTGTFSFQDWTFIPTQGNWTMNTSQGNPAPAVFFTGTSAVQDYQFTMQSSAQHGEPWICANIYLEFDYKLTDVASGGTEKLIAEFFVDNAWYHAIEVKNEGSTGWVHQKIDISEVGGKWFRIGFLATGLNSANITSWAVDNIRVTPVCKGPVACDYTKPGNTVHLFWQNPQCDSIGPFLGYNIYRSHGPAFSPYAKLNASLITDTAYNDIIPAGYPYNQFRYVITAVHHDPTTLMVLCEAPCDTLEVDLSLGTGFAGNKGIQIFPNPASEFIRILSESPVESCELLNFMGKIILSVPPGKSNELTIPVSTLPSGIYLVCLKNASGKFLSKVSVRH